MSQFTIGVAGVGQFAPSFVPLFKAHPNISDVYLCDVVPERAERIAHEYGLRTVFQSYDDLLASDVDAVAILTQRWLHGPMAVAALEHGKHVYSAVPMGISMAEIEHILALVETSGLTYMMGETSYYYPAAVYCRNRFQNGEFGEFVYGEGEYLHDMSDGFYKAFQYSGGPDWKATASFPPMFYPTHSVAMVLAVTGSHVTSVSCIGIKDHSGDGVFDASVSMWDNDLSNEVALFSTAEGGALRINELRRVGVSPYRPEVRLSLFGTRGAFEQQTGAVVWQTHHGYEDVLEQVTQVKPGNPPDAANLAGVDAALLESFRSGFAPVHDTSVLPAEFSGLPNGHEGSHQFLVNDFATAVAGRTPPPVNAWTAARYTIPGLIAHESALKGGVRLDVPDFGPLP